MPTPSGSVAQRAARSRAESLAQSSRTRTVQIVLRTRDHGAVFGPSTARDVVYRASLPLIFGVGDATVGREGKGVR